MVNLEKNSDPFVTETWIKKYI